MAIKVNPNRMELMKLKKRSTVARRGHKLLKDKFDELMKQFLALVKENKRLRKEVEAELDSAYRYFAFVRGEASAEELEQAFTVPLSKTALETSVRSMMNIKISEFEIKREPMKLSYSLAVTPANLDTAIGKFNVLIPKLVNLTQLENTVYLMAVEIEKTRRRVNALEYVLIPQLDQTVSLIQMKLDEIERDSRTRTMKIKEMVS